MLDFPVHILWNNASVILVYFETLRVCENELPKKLLQDLLLSATISSEVWAFSLSIFWFCYICYVNNGISTIFLLGNSNNKNYHPKHESIVYCSEWLLLLNSRRKKREYWSKKNWERSSSSSNASHSSFGSGSERGTELGRTPPNKHHDHAHSLKENLDFFSISNCFPFMWKLLVSTYKYNACPIINPAEPQFPTQTHVNANVKN